MKKRVLCFALLGVMLFGSTVSYSAEAKSMPAQNCSATYDEK